MIFGMITSFFRNISLAKCGQKSVIETKNQNGFLTIINAKIQKFIYRCNKFSVCIYKNYSFPCKTLYYSMQDK